MPLDINLIREDKGGNPQQVRDSQIKRHKDPAIIDQCIELDKIWRQERHDLDSLQREANLISEFVKKRMQETKGQDQCLEKREEAKQLNEKVVEKKKSEAEAQRKFNELYNEVGNIVGEGVPVAATEDENATIKTWGEVEERKMDGTLGNLHHHEVLRAIDGYEPERGQKIMGHRGYFLKGYGALLNQALINYGVSFLTKRSYTVIQPPVLIKQSIMEETCEIGDFEENLYKVESTKDETGKMGEPWYLIATSEQPISALYRKEWLEESELPKRFAGISPCFRKEAGSHGKDVWGIFRVHQFEKVEQFAITVPEKSEEMHAEMMKVSEEFYQGLKLPYRIVAIVSSALNNAAAKKYDLEAWFPGYGTYRELVSCSNCTDYQSRGLEVRCGIKKTDMEKKYVHMLNGTLCATERTMCCILENYQEAEGVRVPKVLVPFMGGIDFIPYDEKSVAKLFKDKEDEKRKQEKKGGKGKKKEKGEAAKKEAAPAAGEKKEEKEQKEPKAE